MSSVPRDLEQLKIVVVSTPKTGNTWVRYLLAKIYRLPMRDLPAEVESFDWGSLGPRWIGQQHFFPSPTILKSAAEAGVVFVTTLRHPADVLVSLYYHVHRTGERSEAPAEPGYMHSDREGLSAAALSYAQQGFFQMLHLSITWLRSGVAHLTRYEDLLTRPFETLTGLCGQIASAPPSAIRWAISESEIGELRRANPDAAGFFRQGNSGSWQNQLSPEIRAVLETQPPYPEQFRELGYSLADDFSHSPSGLRVRNPFRGRDTFDDGSPIAPVLKQVFFQLPEALACAFPENVSTAPGSYFAWLNQPAHGAPSQDREMLVVTELAYRIHRMRDDLGARWPDIFGDDRWPFLAWFAEAGLSGYGLADPFGAAIFNFGGDNRPARSIGFCFGNFGRFENGEPVSFAVVTAFAALPLKLQMLWRNPYWSGGGSFFDWLRSRSDRDPLAAQLPPISNLGLHLYEVRPDVQARFPDLFGQDRKRFDLWLRTHALQEYKLSSLLIHSRSQRARPRRRSQIVKTLRLLIWPPRRETVNTPRVV